MVEGILEPFMLMLYTVSGILHYTNSHWLCTDDPLTASEFAIVALNFSVSD